MQACCVFIQEGNGNTLPLTIRYSHLLHTSSLAIAKFCFSHIIAHLLCLLAIVPKCYLKKKIVKLQPKIQEKRKKKEKGQDKTYYFKGKKGKRKLLKQ